MGPLLVVGRGPTTRSLGDPVSKCLGSPPCINHLAHLEGEPPQVGDYLGDVPTITMVMITTYPGPVLGVILRPYCSYGPTDRGCGGSKKKNTAVVSMVGKLVTVKGGLGTI